MVKDSSTENDSLLTPWLQALRMQDKEAAESALALLIETHIEPVIRSIIRFKLRLDKASRIDEADLTQEALAQWLAELQKLSARPDEHSINDARGLAATITYRVCYAWLRRRSPHRYSIRNRLRYVLTRQAGLALWTNDGKSMNAGFAAWRGRPQTPSDILRQLPGDEKFLALASRLITNQPKQREAKLNELLATIFDYIGGPVAFDELVNVAATLLQVKDELPALTDVEIGYAQLASGEDVEWQVEKRIFLERLWQEVRELPRSQRVSLLFNLRDSSGRGCLALFPVTGVATLRQIAETLEFPLEQFAELWLQMPLDDATIGGLLNLSRQQVINLRKSGRERLARRLKGFF